MPQSIVRAKAELWQARLDQFSKCRLSVQKFCKKVGCSEATFYYWKQKLHANPGELQPAKSNLHVVPDNVQSTATVMASADPISKQDFIPIAITDRSDKIIITLPNGTRITVPARATEALAIVLAHAQGGATC